MELSLSPTSGTTLLRYVSAINEFPETLGAQKFSTVVRAKFREGLRQLRKLLKEVSPIMRDEDLLVFGPRQWYNQVKSTPDEIKAGAEATYYQVVKRAPGKPHPEIALRVAGKALDMGCPAVFLLWTHPDSKLRLSVGDMDDLAWPLIAQLKLTPWVEQNTGLRDGETFEVTREIEDEKPEHAAASPS